MTAPVAYTRYTNFVSYALNNPTAHYNPADHDAEFNAILLTLGGTLLLLNGITRSDGGLKNGIVTIDSLSAEVILATDIQLNPRGLWVSVVLYTVKNLVQQDGQSYICSVAHTSGVFATDFSSGKWVLFSSSAANALQVIFTPTSNISATNVSAALIELDNEFRGAVNLSLYRSQGGF